MPFVEKRLISPTSLTTSASTALYTVPAGYTAIVKQIVVTNTTGTAATFTMYIGAASAGNALFSGTSVAANDTVIINLSQVLGTGEILRALSGTNAALNLTVSGVENDGPLAQNAMYIADNAITTAKVADGAITGAKIAPSPTISLPSIDNFKLGFTTTVTSAGTTTLTNASNNQQVFTGTATQIIVMPVASTMTVGTRYVIENNSNKVLGVYTSDGSTFISTIIPGTSIKATNILASGTTAASWDVEYVGFNAITGTGSNVMSDSPAFTGTPTAPTASAVTNSTQIATTAYVTTADNLKANIASPTFTGLLSAAGITASGTVRGSGSIVQVVSANQGATDLQSAGYAGTVTMTPKFADSNILVWINYHAYKYNTTPAVNNYYQLRNVTAGTVIRENPYMVYSSPEYMFQGVISGIQSAGSTSSRQYGLLVDSSASARIYFYWSTTYAMEIAV